MTREELITNGQQPRLRSSAGRRRRATTYGTVTDKISAVVADVGCAASAGSSGSPSAFVLRDGAVLIAVTWLFVQGRRHLGHQRPGGWGFDIINFVWWIGIGHAGTLISAILLLLKQHWRTSINRFAEAMTLFAVACAGMYPRSHTWASVARLLAVAVSEHDGRCGRSSRSPLMWDVFAVSTYATVSLLFWYVGSDSRPGDDARSGEDAIRRR